MGLFDIFNKVFSKKETDKPTDPESQNVSEQKSASNEGSEEKPFKTEQPEKIKEEELEEVDGAELEEYSEKSPKLEENSDSESQLGNSENQNDSENNKEENSEDFEEEDTDKNLIPAYVEEIEEEERVEIELPLLDDDPLVLDEDPDDSDFEISEDDSDSFEISKDQAIESEAFNYDDPDDCTDSNINLNVELEGPALEHFLELVSITSLLDEDLSDEVSFLLPKLSRFLSYAEMAEQTQSQPPSILSTLEGLKLDIKAIPEEPLALPGHWHLVEETDLIWTPEEISLLKEAFGPMVSILEEDLLYDWRWIRDLGKITHKRLDPAVWAEGIKMANDTGPWLLSARWTLDRSDLEIVFDLLDSTKNAEIALALLCMNQDELLEKHLEQIGQSTYDLLPSMLKIWSHFRNRFYFAFGEIK